MADQQSPGPFFPQRGLSFAYASDVGGYVDLQRWDRAKELVGNTFELTTLIQKRCRELVKGKQRKLVDLESRNPIQIALEEVLQGKIHLAPPPPPEVVQEMAETPEVTGEAEVAPAAGEPTIEVKID